jgi:hypothetical protein
MAARSTKYYCCARNQRPLSARPHMLVGGRCWWAVPSNIAVMKVQAVNNPENGKAAVQSLKHAGVVSSR